jgi:hypothetical protein
LRFSRSEPGLVLSVAVHAGLLLAILFVYSDTRKFEDAQEYVPVDVVTDQQFNQIMKGEKTAREVKKPRVDKVASEPELKPKPPLAEAKRDTPAPPPPLKRLQEPEEDDKPDPPTPPKRVVAQQQPEPPPPPTPPQRPQQKASPEPEKTEPQEAEVVKPKPAERQKPEKQAETTPKPEKPQPAPPRKEKPHLKVDEVAKLLKEKKQTERPDEKAEKTDKTEKPAKPKSGDENAPKSKFNAASIATLLSREAPQRQASTGRELTHTASLGAPTANAAKMSPSLQAQIDSYTIEHYSKCWREGLSMSARTYVPQVEFHLTRDGALEGAPRLLNPASDPVDRSRGEQALAAVRRCSPMPIPAAFAPYYDYWRVTEMHMKENM